jgi:TolB protein
MFLGIPRTLAAQSPPLSLAYQLTNSVNADPSFTADGKRMVYISVVNSREQLFARNLDGSDPVQLTHDDADHEDPAWSPDGKSVAYVLLKGDTERIYIMNANGSDPRPLTAAGVRTIHPSWSPDGRSVAYCTDDDLKPPYKNPAQIYSIDVARGKITQLIAGGVNTYPVWSPDGRQIAYVAKRAKQWTGEDPLQIWVMNADGSGRHPITRTFGWSITSWAPAS